MIKKLQTAINGKGEKLLYQTSQFFSEEQNRPVTVYHIKKAVWDEEKNRSRNVELFKSTSQIQIVLYLRDYWYRLNNIPLPTDNEEWEKIKEKWNGQYRNEQI
jgi:hypothetical protein